MTSKNSKPIVVLLGPIPANIPEYVEFSTDFNLIPYVTTTTENFIKDFSKEPFCWAEAIYGSWPGFTPIGGLHDEKILNVLPRSLKIITLCSAGYNGYDLNKLRESDITLCNTPTFGNSDVADLALWHVLGGFRKLSFWNNETKKNFGKGTIQIRSDVAGNKLGYSFGHVMKGTEGYVRSPKNKTAVIVGFGTIGKEVGKRLNVLGMKIRCVTRHRLDNDTIQSLGFNVDWFNDLSDACANVDCIILCLPGNDQTIGILGMNVLKNVNKGCIVVNVGRGFLIKENELIDAVNLGLVGHVAMDVYPDEPEINQFWASDENTTLTPHIGSSTVENFNETAIFCMKNIKNALFNGVYENSVN